MCRARAPTRPRQLLAQTFSRSRADARGRARADGLLGMDFLEHFTLTVDSAAGRVTLTPKYGYKRSQPSAPPQSSPVKWYLITPREDPRNPTVTTLDVTPDWEMLATFD